MSILAKVLPLAVPGLLDLSFCPRLLLSPIPVLGPWLPELFFLACCGVGLMTLWLAQGP